MAYSTDFGLAIKNARKKKKYTQQRLAAAVDVTYASISKYESDAVCPSLEVMCRIADVLGTSMDQLCGFEENGKLSLHNLTADQSQLLADLAELLRENNTAMRNHLSSRQYEMLGRITEMVLNNK